jgi:hypothetical protein
MQTPKPIRAIVVSDHVGSAQMASYPTGPVRTAPMRSQSPYAAQFKPYVHWSLR